MEQVYFPSLNAYWFPVLMQNLFEVVQIGETSWYLPTTHRVIGGVGHCARECVCPDPLVVDMGFVIAIGS
jgi:hypothetical protein